MADTPEIQAKKADAQEVVNDLNALKAKLEAFKNEPHWFGGLPPSLEQAASMCEHHGRAITEVFQL
jgi:hypothetical protein